ncbi:probable leucine-rich repeat receptor-like serine/threonine-protein kinase At3g14840 [Andrographis paniculata]|uniref:probable leucine-rich repeat receptor-like serine/threonine-protein kinase At3g14840 n=1 Tax=Andrographis paniculata TaxID=175694 RepID=UPI0021E90F09|nr:probable leucine-rich repeat receptor-like serine/threonine-protein kinase At3g14840 [Andrographis paniculata]
MIMLLKLPPRFLVFFLLICAPTTAVLPQNEVEALRAVGRTVGKMDWDFDVDPCSGLSGWTDPFGTKENMTAVTCNCTFANNTICHVVSIQLKAQNLNGSVPKEIIGLPFIEEIELSRNYLSGTIPKEWGTLKLRNISLLGNRVTGSIPKELGNISTLGNLTLEYNQLSGPLPTELGDLLSITKFSILSNNFTGELPPELGKLTTLKDFRIGDNNFTGRIPDFIQNWKNITRLVIQASGLSGPIPPGIADLTKLTDLRISDLSGNDTTTFPDLSNISELKTLILRSCNIVGTLPKNLGAMKPTVLDLSFNKLSGPIPDSYGGLFRTKYIYLTGNSLSGPVPSWMISQGKNIDLSYNNLTSEGLSQICQPRESNLFASSEGHNSGIVSCLREVATTCERNFTSVYINCGGGQVAVDKDTTYVDDMESGRASQFYQGKPNWGFSSTGHFMDNDDTTDTFIMRTKDSVSGQNPQLYKDARQSPLSLTYYSYCLINGNYTVSLYFAEIVFTNDSTFSSLGRRIFDVYIQGKLVLKDFNIANEAGGVRKGIVRNFTAIVDDNTLDIRFYWAGKGTTALPSRGVYGPLISAISVKSDFPPPPEIGSSSGGGGGISAGAVVGIVAAVIFGIFLVLAILWWMGCLRRKDTLLRDLKGLGLPMGPLSLRQIKAATNNFDPANKIGEGGFGPVYKGHLSDSTIIAVKQLSSKSKQGNREFLNEIGMISALQHPHLVKLYGCCIEGNQLLLVYEYMENNSLARALFGPEEHQLHLDWPTRQKIVIGIARGLAYLHEESRLKIVHRDIKTTNVLLDKNLVPKISDFGLAKLDEEDNTHISTRVAGTYGYMAPEYAMRGHLSDKADVYSFGVVLLEIVSGRSNASIKQKEASFYLLDWANSLKAKGELLELVDPRLGSNYNRKEAMAAINLALLCTNAVAAERPSMSTVVSMLEGKEGLFEFEHVDQMSEEDAPMMRRGGGSDGESLSMDFPWTASSASAAGDLYPISVNSEYWAKRDA